MGLGILESSKTPVPPGTTLLADKELDLRVTEETRHLKHRDGVILVPQPSESPNDPLNWPTSRKNWMLAILSVALATVMSAGGAVIAASRWLQQDFGIQFPEVIQKLAVPKTAALAGAFFLTSAISAVWGKRVLIVTSLIAFTAVQTAGIWWNGLDYLAIIGGFQGAVSSPIELLLGPIISDIYFIHERASKLALIGVLANIGGDIGGAISGQIIDRSRKHGIQHTFIVSAAIMVPIVIMVYLYCPETTYQKRMIALEYDSQHHELVPEKLEDSVASISSVEIANPENKGNGTQVTSRPVGSHENLSREQPHTFRQKLRVFHGRVTDRSFVKSILQPWPLMVFPSVLYSTIVNGAMMTWGIVSSIITFQVLSAKPYALTPGQLAIIGIPNSIVALFGTAFAGWFCDFIAKKMAARNKGVFEPEFRLVMMIPAAIFSTLAFCGSAWFVTGSKFDYSEFIKLKGKTPPAAGLLPHGNSTIAAFGPHVNSTVAALAPRAVQAASHVLARGFNAATATASALATATPAFAAAGNATFGALKGNYTLASKFPPFGPVDLGPKRSIIALIGFGCLHAIAAPFASSAVLTYIMDCQQKNATEAFVATTFFKAMFAVFALEFTNSWYTKSLIAGHPQTVFYTLALLNLGIASLTIPMYIFGKKFRALVSRNAWLTKVTKVA